ncbi:MAG: hypothetical protein KGQ67_09610 [Betaproteobacteria bacterium]|nr:hypothetical protein [Betaproteobacteria bacterium]
MLRQLILCSALLVPCLCAPTPARAGPNDYIRLPTVVHGERELDYKTGFARHRDGSSDAAQSLGYGFTPTPWWFTELYAKTARNGAEPSAFDAWEWENRFQLTESGRYPVLLGMLLEIERPRDRREGYEITVGPMMQSEWGAVQGNLNLFLRRHLRAEEAFDTELLVQMQLKYRQARAFEWGLQGFGNTGPWRHALPGSRQDARLGPAIFGKLRAAPGQAIGWNAALLEGLNRASPRTTLRLQAEYEF